MRYRELRNLLQPIVIAGLPVIAAGCVESVIDTDCIDTLERSYHFETPADPPLQFRIDRCRLDVDVCKELCQLAIERDSVDSEPSRCHVSFGGSGVSVDVSFEVFTSGDGCGGGDPIFRRTDGLAPVTPVAPSSTPAPASAAPELSHEPHARSRSGARTPDSLWNGGRTCHV